jgi:hypothetical protein
MTYKEVYDVLKMLIIIIQLILPDRGNFKYGS